MVSPLWVMQLRADDGGGIFEAQLAAEKLVKKARRRREWTLCRRALSCAKTTTPTASSDWRPS